MLAIFADFMEQMLWEIERMNENVENCLSRKLCIQNLEQ